MAKLEGVKVIDMKDGEVTRIAYEGAYYAKVEGTANKGDIVRITQPQFDMTTGAYYKAVSSATAWWYAEFEDDEGDLNTPVNYDTYRKVSVPSHEERISDLETRVDTLEGRTAEESTQEPLEDVELKAGDKILITDACFAWGEYKNGDILTVKEWLPENAGMFERVYVEEADTDVLTHEFVRIYDKPARVGDTILITDAYKTGGRYTDGDELTVTKVGSDGWVDKTEEIGEHLIDPDEFEIIGRKEDEDKPKIAIGDYAKVTGDAYFVDEGDIVEVVGQAEDIYDYIVERVGDRESEPFYADHLEKVELSERDLSFIRAGRKIDEFEAKDIAEVMYSPSASPEGTLVEIESVRADGLLHAKGWSDALERAGQRYSYTAENLKLIAPAESRVDRDD